MTAQSLYEEKKVRSRVVGRQTRHTANITAPRVRQEGDTFTHTPSQTQFRWTGSLWRSIDGFTFHLDRISASGGFFQRIAFPNNVHDVLITNMWVMLLVNGTANDAANYWSYDLDGHKLDGSRPSTGSSNGSTAADAPGVWLRKTHPLNYRVGPVSTSSVWGLRFNLVKTGLPSNLDLSVNVEGCFIYNGP